MNALVTVVCLASLSVYALASRLWFWVPDRVGKGMRLIEASFLIGAILNTWNLLRGPITQWHGWAAVLLYAVALGLFVLACIGSRHKQLTMAFTTDAPVLLFERGIYGRIRHPFYAAYCLTWLAGLVALFHPALLLFALWMTVLYTAAARAEERKFLCSPLATQYRSYRERAGMFFPRWPFVAIYRQHVWVYLRRSVPPCSEHLSVHSDTQGSFESQETSARIIVE